jgi:hypothetical protein
MSERPISANFAFLSEHDPQIVRLGALAERYFRPTRVNKQLARMKTDQNRQHTMGAPVNFWNVGRPIMAAAAFQAAFNGSWRRGCAALRGNQGAVPAGPVDGRRGAAEHPRA